MQPVTNENITKTNRTKKILPLLLLGKIHGWWSAGFKQIVRFQYNQCTTFCLRNFVHDLRCVYTEYDEIFRTYSDVGYETVRGYDVKPRHYPRHSRIQSLGALQNNR